MLGEVASDLVPGPGRSDPWIFSCPFGNCQSLLPCLCEDRLGVDCQVVLPTLSLLKAFLADLPPV